jgi:putative ABC transport system permease protein
MNSPLWNHYLLTLYRNLTRQRLYAALNVLGLAVGIAVFLVLWLDVRFETGFERWLPGADQVYIIRTTWPGQTTSLALSRGTSGAVIEALEGDYPGLAATRVWDQSGTVRQGGRITPEKVEVVDPGFFKVFDLPLVAGDRSTLLSAPDAVVVSQSRARRYFGGANPIGRNLTVVTQGVPGVYRVTGVLKDPPPDTEHPFDVIVPLTPQMTRSDPTWRDWNSMQAETYLRLETPARAKALDLDFDSFLDRHVSHDLGRTPHKDMRLRTQPLMSLHLLDPKDAAVVAGLGGVGLLTLILAAVNYVNLATARAG